MLNILVQFVPFDNHRKEKETSEGVLFYFEQRIIISIICAAYSNNNRNNVEELIWSLVSKHFRKTAQFPVPSSFFKGFQTYHHSQNI